MKHAILYHNGCPDGWASAYLLRSELSKASVAAGEDKLFIDLWAVDHKGAVPDVGNAEKVWIVDFSYPKDILRERFGKSKAIIVLDHHLSAMRRDTECSPTDKTFTNDTYDMHSGEAGLEDTIIIRQIFNMDRSGVGVVWDYFHPNGEEMPYLYQCVQDGDLWKFVVPMSKEIIAAVESYPYTVKAWDALMSMDPLGALLEEGKAILRFQDVIRTSYIGMGYSLVNLDGWTVPCINIPYDAASDVLHQLAEKYPFALSYYDTGSIRRFSMRSREEGADVQAIAVNHGGGGHKNAAGFEMPLTHSPLNP